MQKIIISLDMLKSKSKKKIWVAPGKRKGHYREVEVGTAEKPLDLHIKEILTFEEAGMEGGIHNDNSFIIRHYDGSQSIYKVMNRINVFGEKVSYKFSKMFGWDNIPVTHAGDYGRGYGSVQKWIPDGDEPYAGYDSFGTKLTDKHINDLSKIYLMDMLMGNHDRHEGNVVIKGDRAFMIDNEDFGHIHATQEQMDSLDSGIKGERDKFRNLNVMLNWIEENDVPNIHKKLKAAVINNMYDILRNGSQIKKYIDSLNYKEMKIPLYNIREIQNISKNLDEMKEYYKKTIGIKDNDSKYNEMCQMLNIMPKYPLTESQITHEIEILEGKLQKTRGSPLYMRKGESTKFKINLITRRT